MASAAVLDFISLAQPWLSIDPLPDDRGLPSCSRYCTFVHGGFQSGSTALWIGAATCLLLLVTLFYIIRSPMRPDALQLQEAAVISLLSAILTVVMIWQLLAFEHNYSWWIQHDNAHSPSMTGAAFFGPLGAIVALGASVSLWFRRHGVRRAGRPSIHQPDRVNY
jgi:hypothetical protein